jgi:signal transduction histidine kinase
VLSDGGLAPALGALASRSTPKAKLIEAPGDRLPAPVEATAYFVVAEALTNMTRYAEASSATVSAVLDKNTLRVEVRDDGKGGAEGNGSGLRGLADRVAALGGRLYVESPPGQGTIVRVSIPCG